MTVRAKFQFSRHGILYKKGDPLQMSEKDQDEAVRMGLAYFDASVSMSNTKADIQAYLDVQGINYGSTATKRELLSLIP